MRNPVKKSISAACACFVFAGFLSSCSVKDDSKGFMSAMDSVDIYIKNGDVNEALKLLKKSEKKAFSSYARLGVYRRYAQLGEEILARKTLENAYKKLPENPEIEAVYGNYLLRRGETEKSLKITEKLAGTKYGSIHSEAMLKSLTEGFFAGQSNLKDEKSPLFEKEISSSYFDIYAGTGDKRWLRNCALIYLMRGDYSLASSLQSAFSYDELDDSEDALFWGFVQYDSGNYDIAVKNLEKVKSDLLSGTAASLASDSYAKLDDFDSAEEARNSYMSRAKSYVKIAPSMMVNSALWAYRHEDYKRAYELLVNAVSDYPDYVPGLVSYGKLAWIDSQPAQMTDLEISLRKTNLRTLKMRNYDDRPKFNIEDAVSRMEELLEKENSLDGEKNDDLIVERLSLFMRENDALPLAKKTALIWSELEKNRLGTNLYPPHLVQFCVQKLLSFGLVEDARTLFTDFITTKFNLNYQEDKNKEKKVETDIFGGEKTVKNGIVPPFIAKLAFGDKAAAAASKMEIWEVEFAAYFALLDENVSAAKRLYEYANFETGGAKTANAGGEYISVSPLCASSSSANLAMIYSSQNEKKKALNLYTLAAGKTFSKKTKSKLLYRIANLQIGMGRKDDALNSAAYAVSLDPSNADARLLLNQHK